MWNRLLFLHNLGHNRRFRTPLALVRRWGKSGSRWARDPDLVPIAVTPGFVRHAWQAHGPDEKKEAVREEDETRQGKLI